eukprot:g8574.t1
MDIQRRAIEPGVGCPSYYQKGKRARSRQRTPRCNDDGSGDGDIVCGAKHKNDAVASPSLEILTRDYGKDGGNAMVCDLTVAEKAAASAPRPGEERRGGWMERGNDSGGGHGKVTPEEARDTEASKGKPPKTRSSATAKDAVMGMLANDIVAGDDSPPRRLLTSKPTCVSGETMGGDAQRFSNSVLPLALPGEAHNMSFGAAAKAVVLVSGSSRLMVSSKRRKSRKQQKQLWELHHAAVQIQRVWRGYVARAHFWTDGGIGLHAVATRIQRIFRGWRGKVRACKALVEKRARAAAIISALGRGFQGRREASRLRVARYNAAAATIQNQFRARAARRWKEQMKLAAAIRRAGQIQAAWRGKMARRRFRVFGLRLSLEEEALKAICYNYAGRRGWAGNQASTPETESAVNMVTPSPALPEGFWAQCDCSCSDKAGRSDKVDHELAIGSRDGQPGPAERPVLSKRTTSAAGSTDAQKPEVSGVPERVFGGAFSPDTVVSPPADGSVALHSARAPAADSAAPERDRDLSASTVVASTTSIMLAAASPTSPSENFFIAYGHCLLAGAGTGASDEAAEAATERGQRVTGDFGGASGRARVRKKKRIRGYGDALEATWFTDGRGDSPMTAMLEASMFLLSRAWAQDPNRRAYHQAEAFFLAAARIARRRLRRAEEAAAAAREAVLAEIRAAKELSAAERAAGHYGGFTEGQLGGLRKATTREEAVYDEEQEELSGGIKEEEEEEEEQGEPEEVTVCKKAAAVATLHVALWSQIANGNHDMDLRRADTLTAYRRTGRLYARAALLDDACTVPEIGASERVFAALYRNKHKLVTTRQLRLKLPPHPEPSPLEGPESGGSGVKDKALLALLDSTGDPAESRKLQQKKREQQRHEHNEEQEKQRKEQREEERQLQRRQQQKQQRQQHHQQQDHEQRLQPQPIQLTLANTPLSPTASGNSSPKRPHTVRRMASKVAAIVREGTRKIITWHSPRSSSRSPRAFGLGATATDAIDGRGTPGNDVTKTKDGESVLRQPAGGKAIGSCPNDSPANNLSGDVSEAPASTTAMDMADSHRATFFSEPKPLQDQQRQQPRQQEHQDAAATGLSQLASHMPSASDCANSTDEKSAAYPAVKLVAVQEKSVRVTLTALRCGAKLVLRILERDAAERVGVGETSSAGAGAGPEKTAEGKACLFEERPQPPLGEAGAIVIIHEEEMERLVVAAIEEQVADGRPRGILEAKDPFSLVSEHFLGKMVLQPECDTDPRYRYSTSRTIGGRMGGFAVGLGRFAAGLPYLDAVRAQQGELSARDEGARVLQRAFGGLLARSKCRSVCYELLQVLTVYHKGTVVSGVPLMLSVLRCGNSYKFIGRDQEECWAHQGYCYEFEARFKTLVVQTTDLALNHDDGSLEPSAECGTVESSRPAIDQIGLRGPGIMAFGAEHGRGLRDTRVSVGKGLKRFHKRQAKWEETRRKQAYMQHHEQMKAAAQD